MSNKLLVSLAGFMAVFMVSLAGVSTASADTPGYWTNKSGDEIWRNRFGQCWRTRDWKPEYAIPECEGTVESVVGANDEQDSDPDSDQDGIVDSMDRCPATPAGVAVNSQGCEPEILDGDGDGITDDKDKCPTTPQGAAVDSTGCEQDSDNDGVADSQDRCPNTPAGAAVNATGCELDGDGDGIVDSQDRCPGSAAGATVDAQGCQLEENIVLKGVNFETNSDALAGSSHTQLDEIASTLKRYPEMKVEVAGYTDNRGSVRYNQALSQRRAEAVVKYLVSKGVAAGNLSAKGYGPAAPIADNSTAAGQAANRRVEMHILEQ